MVSLENSIKYLKNFTQSLLGNQEQNTSQIIFEAGITLMPNQGKYSTKKLKTAGQCIS